MSIFTAVLLVAIAMCAIVGMILLSILKTNRRILKSEQEKTEILRQSEMQYRSLVESMEETVVQVDQEGKYHFLHTTIPELKHLNSSKYIGTTVFDVLPQDTADDFMVRIRDVFKTGRSRNDEREVDVGKGKSLWVSTQLTPQLNAAGNVETVLAVSRDITKRKEIVNLLLASEKKYRSLVDSMEDTIFVVDKKGEFEFIRTNLQPLLHLNEGGYLGKTLYDLLPKKYAENLMERIAEVFRTGTSRLDDFHYIFNNKKLWVSSRLTPQLNEAGQIVSILGVSRDTTQQMETVELLIDSENKYRSLVQSMEESVIVLDRDGNYLFHQSPSPFVQHLNNEGYIGKSVYDSIPKKSADRLMANVRNVFSTKRSHFDENHIDLGKGIQRWITYRATPQLNSAGEVVSVLVISTDTTNRKILENDLKDSVKTLKSQQKTLHQLSRELINTQEMERQRISHELHDDIGQSLTAISLTLESINQDKRNEAKLKDRIKDSQKLVQKTIDDVHRFSYALRPPIIDDLGLIPALQSQAESFQKRTGIIVKIKSNKEVENTSNEIKTILYRVFQEGLNNIAKHSKASAARIVLVVEDHSISLEIFDNGKGFDTNKVPKISEKGNQGLQGIEERIKLVGGSLRLQSNSKSGTTLTVKAPYAKV